MRRFWSVALGAALLGSACKIERTPQEYIDHRDLGSVSRREAREELQARLLALGQALSRGSTTEALAALDPAPEAYLLTSADPAMVAGRDSIVAAVERVSAAAADLQVEEVQVTVGPRASTAWFHARVRTGGGEESRVVALSGTFVRGDEGGWQLVQGHLSPVDSLATRQSRSPAPDGSAPEDG